MVDINLKNKVVGMASAADAPGFNFKADIRATLTTKKNLIQADKLKFADDKIAELDGWIAKMPHRKATKKGNITMAEHLANLKADVQKDKIGFAQREIAKLDAEIAKYVG